jgi:hypothetical protein
MEISSCSLSWNAVHGVWRHPAMARFKGMPPERGVEVQASPDFAHLLLDTVINRANAFDRNTDHIPGFQELRRRKADTDADWRAGDDDIARL